MTHDLLHFIEILAVIAMLMFSARRRINRVPPWRDGRIKSPEEMERLRRK